MTAATDTFDRLKARLRELGVDEVRLETTDQSAGYGFVLTAAFILGRELPPQIHQELVDDLMDRNLLDIDWDGPVGENKQGYARIDLR